MKILQVNKFFYPRGGSETYFFNVINALEDEGHDVIHFSMQDERNLPSPYADFFIRNIDFQGKKTVGKAAHYMYSLEATEMVKRLVKKTKPDVAHVHNIAHQLTPSIFVALRQMGVPVVQTLHDYQLLCPNYQLFTQGSPCERCKQKKYWNAVKYNCVQNSKAASALSAAEMTFHNVLLKTYEWGVNRYIAPSQFMYAKLLEWGWQKSRIAYIPHFIEKKPVAGIAKKAQLVFIGRFTKAKGAEVLLQAARSLPDVTIVFAGSGDEEAGLRTQAQALSFKHCSFVGFQNAAQVDRLIQESMAVVVPSLWYENAPMVVYEALALGTPVIGSKLGGIVELVKEGRNGYLFDPANAADLVSCVRKLQQHPMDGIDAKVFSKASHLKSLHALYQAVSTEKKSFIPI